MIGAFLFLSGSVVQPNERESTVRCHGAEVRS